jgi:6-phosphogluconolactonase (cycloisomerase 2 family)
MRLSIARFLGLLICLVVYAPLSAQGIRTTFLFLLEGKGVPTGTIHVFTVNTSTGAIAEVPGSPFNAGLIPNQIIVDPTGRFLYVTNEQSTDITALSIDPTSGTLTEMPGSPFQIGAQPVTAAVDPSGRFLYVFATNPVLGAGEEFLYEFMIDNTTGILTPAVSNPTTWEPQQGTLFTSIAFNSAGNYAYLGQVAGGNLGAPIVICSLDFNSGALAPAGSVQPGTTGEADRVFVSPTSNFLYSINSTFSQADAFIIDLGGGSLNEIAGSPYSLPYGPYSLVVHPAGKFLYIANSNSSFQAPPTSGPVHGSIYAFSINPGTAALTPVSGSPYLTGFNPNSIVVDPTGNFAYWTSTANPTGELFAQIMGFAINPSTGALTPLPGMPWADPITSSSAQLVIANGAFTMNPVPVISSLSPPSAIAAGAAFTMQITGANFVSGSTVYFAGQLRNTTYVSSTQLNAAILASDLVSGGIIQVAVFNPLPGGGTSAPFNFPVSVPVPVASAISPASSPAEGPAFQLRVIGTSFVTGSIVNFNGVPLPTSYEGTTVIGAEIWPAQIVTEGTATISVTSPSTGLSDGGTSNTIVFSIVAPISLLGVSNISPSSATAGGPAFVLTVNGAGFVQGSQVSFNLINVPTSLVNSTQLIALISSSSIAIAGNPYVIVTNPGGATSAALTFTVNPGVSSISPSSLPAGSNASRVNVAGAGFATGSLVLVNGNSRPTAYVSPTLLQPTVLATDLSKGGTLTLTVVNPPPSDGISEAIGLTVADYSVVPSTPEVSVTAGQTAHFVLTVSPVDGAFTNPVTFHISPSTPLPAGSAASFGPSVTITPGASPQSVTLSISTTALTASHLVYFPHGGGSIWMWLSVAVTVLGLAIILLRMPEVRMQRRAPQILLAFLLVVASVLVACSAVGTGTSPPSIPSSAPGTPAGTYPIIVTAISGGVSHSTTVTLTVMQ